MYYAKGLCYMIVINTCLLSSSRDTVCYYNKNDYRYIIRSVSRSFNANKYTDIGRYTSVSGSVWSSKSKSISPPMHYSYLDFSYIKKKLISSLAINPGML